MDIVLLNSLKDPTYRPYCMPCPGLQRMAIIERFYWKCPKCGAIHDAREEAKAQK